MNPKYILFPPTTIQYLLFSGYHSAIARGDLVTRARGFGSRVENSRFFLRIISLHSYPRGRSSSGLGKVMSSSNTL